MNEIKHFIKTSKVPLAVAGHGVRLAGAIPELFIFLEKYHIPVVTTFNGFDIIPSDYPLFRGRIGTVGTEQGNKVLREATLIIFLGTRNNIRQIGYNWRHKFVPNISKLIVDIDYEELLKLESNNYCIEKDIKKFLLEMLDD